VGTDVIAAAADAAASPLTYSSQQQQQQQVGRPTQMRPSSLQLAVLTRYVYLSVIKQHWCQC